MAPLGGYIISKFNDFLSGPQVPKWITGEVDVGGAVEVVLAGVEVAGEGAD